jgi:hypothetical protein
VAEFGTPVFVYSAAVLDRTWGVVRSTFPSRFSVCYSVKANSNLAVLTLLSRLRDKGYVLITELVVAALAFLLSVSTDSPLGAVGGAVGLVIVSNILDAVTALGSWREILPTHWQFVWLDAFSAQLRWGGMIQGAVVSVSYALVLFALAFRRFRTKDIVS